MAFRYFAFCDEEVDHRINENFHGWNEYFNIAISDHKCIGDKDVGSECIAEDNFTPGTCVLMQTMKLMHADVTINYPLQRQTL